MAPFGLLFFITLVLLFLAIRAALISPKKKDFSQALLAIAIALLVAILAFLFMLMTATAGGLGPG